MATALACTIEGQRLEIEAIKLYPSDRVQELRSLNATAQQQLSGVSTGIGFWGSPEWAIGGALALGFLENAASNAKAKEGVATLQKAQTLSKQLRNEGKFYKVSSIQNVEVANPANWFAMGSGFKPVEMKTINLLERSKFLASHGLDKRDVNKGVANVPTDIPYVVNDDEFISIQSASNTLQIRWKSVTIIQAI